MVIIYLWPMEVTVRTKYSIMTMAGGSQRWSFREYCCDACWVVNDFMEKECYLKFENVIKFEDIQ